MKPLFAILVIFCLLSASTRAGLVSSFTETFGGGTFDHSAWAPLNSASSLMLKGDSVDRDHMDGPNDGSLLVGREGDAIGIHGALRSLGIIEPAEVGMTVSVDFAYEPPVDGFDGLKPLFLVDGVVVAEGVPISVLPSGNDPAAAEGRYASVMVRLACLITAVDVGKELSLAIQYSVGDSFGNRDLLLDSVNFVNPADDVELPPVGGALSGNGADVALELSYARRVTDRLPALQYLVEVSPDLSPWSWILADADESQVVPVGDSYEQVIHRFQMGPGGEPFFRLAVRNKRLGDPGVTFDAEKMDPNYPQMLEWQAAGVEGGIPFRSQRPVVAILEPTDTAGIIATLNKVWREAGTLGGGTVLLKNGTYTIDSTIQMPPNVQLVGESRTGVELLITIQTATDPQETKHAISFDRAFNSGLVNLTIRGGYGTPNPSVMENVKPEFMVNSVNFSYASNCWVDDVDIIDSGSHGINAWRARNVTIRGCTIDGAWNKGAGGRGYASVMADRFLIVENRIRHMRHFGLQKEHCEYNVVFRNFLEQDINFHDDDNGNNLIEGNRIVLPDTLQSNWHAIMGPWSVVHSVSRNDNFIFNNKCVENNNGGLQSFSDSGVVYLGSRNREQQGNVFTTTDVLPVSGTFYPVVLTPESISP